MRRAFLLLAVFLVALAGCGRPGHNPLANGAVGPVLGHLEATTARVWYRAAQAGVLTLDVRAADADGPARTLQAESLPERDRTVVWALADLAPATTYAYEIRDAAGARLAASTFRTAPAPGAAARVRLAVGSCAAIDDHPIWRTIGAAQPDALVFLGDTPYVDSVQLGTARLRHRAFLAVPSLAALLRERPLWSTWDDHDYGADRGDGSMPGKEATRRAYVEYRAQARYGEDGQGVYDVVRYGPVEVFLLDTRWFAGLETLPGDDAAPSCLGTRQRQWLLAALRASDAPFKLLASGMVWHDKGGRSKDDWASFAAERDALFAFLGEARVGGVVLLGGDVHACQHSVFEGTAAGYPLHQLVISPFHGRAWRGGDREHAGRRWGTVRPHVYLLVDADTTVAPARLTATWHAADGTELHRVTLAADALRVP